MRFGEETRNVFSFLIFLIQVKWTWHHFRCETPYFSPGRPKFLEGSVVRGVFHEGGLFKFSLKLERLVGQ